MRSILLSAVLLLLAPSVRADIVVKMHHCVPNRPPGYCGWCCLETAGRYLGVKRFKGLVSRRVKSGEFSGLYYHDAVSVLDSIGVSYKSRREGYKDWKLLKWAMSHDLPAAVGVFNYPESGSSHMVLIVEVNDDWVRFVDPNDINKWFWLKKSVFNRVWTGMIFVISPRR